MIEEIIKKTEKGVLIDIEVTTNAKKNEIGKINKWRKRLEVKIKEQPIEGRANKAILKFLKEIFKTDVELNPVTTSPQKTVLISCDTKEYVVNILKREIKSV
ncbi:protein of unknown function DUF167 [Methanococcus vannielii SB]|uniref:UPF0235 protein Mevan_0378 n=1 Tax=Methanococcus vannielii (strain ATCC 35089 / DSM 1224 / JCM 13029 / OCM 148 / SB) TaxID=406327 RepID=Y378_METVS|nr:DUF167 family protein [Methanococcus vannielii]A6UP65.1 RecName: Full=UPF0235 protein Mevan_0378 [Methanococcus vannielii SB]ABR54287.1 protein of unknown function DUF167 [Methanococcus vannielii SB]